MDPEVQRILIIAIAVAFVVAVALILGRRLSVTWGNKSLKTDERRAAMTMSTRSGSIENAKQIAEGEATADMNMTTRDGKLKDVLMHTGKQSDSSS
jgi:TRAP-type uncharacterized transport system substrate-binding protein